MPAPSISERLRKGDTLRSAWVSLPSPLVAEVLAREPWDAVALDLQHGLVDHAAMTAGIAAVALAGKPSLVRVPLGDFALVSRALDAGATAVIAPMINTVEDARAFAAAAKFPPVGARSWGPTRALMLTGTTPGDYLASANGATFTFAMIETVQALANLDAILDVPGIDGVFVGPSDLSVTLSGGTEVNPASERVDEAMQTVARRASAMGKPAGAYAHIPERARLFADWGFRFIAVGSDVLMLRAGSSALWRAAGTA